MVFMHVQFLAPSSFFRRPEFDSFPFKTQGLYTLSTNKIKVFPLHTIKTYRASNGVIDPLVLNLGSTSRWDVKFKHRPLYSKWRTPGPINKRLGGPQRRAEHFGGKSLAPTWIRTAGSPAKQTTLPRLHCKYVIYIWLMWTFRLSLPLRLCWIIHMKFTWATVTKHCTFLHSHEFYSNTWNFISLIFIKFCFTEITNR